MQTSHSSYPDAPFFSPRLRQAIVDEEVRFGRDAETGKMYVWVYHVLSDEDRALLVRELEHWGYTVQ